MFVLADDLAWNLVDHMSNVQKMQKEGTTFSRYYVTDSLCCPSRTSIFTGRFPHDSGVFTNSGTDGGYGTFKAHENDKHTFAVALQAEGYDTAMMGKYLNGYEPKKNGPEPGWTEWDVAGYGYKEYDYDLNQNGKVASFGRTPEDYMVDVLAGLGSKFVDSASAAKKNFFLEIATFAPHSPYTPAPRHAELFPDIAIPRTPAFAARPKPTDPKWLQAIPALPPREVKVLEAKYRLRVQAVQSVDEMIGKIRAELAATGHDQDTYVVFSSDNGYHMGEHSLRQGKQTAFDTDINVPLIVVGPGVAAGRTVDEIVENIDLCPTFADIANARDVGTVDGRSLVPLLHGDATPNWREVALIEHHGPDEDPTDPDLPPTASGNPTRYEAIRAANEVYVEYADGEKEYHDLATDPNELANTFTSLPEARAKSLADTLAAVKKCTDAPSCWKAQHLKK